MEFGVRLADFLGVVTEDPVDLDTGVIAVGILAHFRIVRTLTK